MRKIRAALFCLAVFCSVAAGAQVKAIWTTPIEPFRIADNLYYVGSQDLASYLIVTSQGNILINTNLPSSPAQIRSSVEKLGFRWTDTKILLIGHAHFDHAGGTAQVQRETHAKLAVMEYDSDLIETGGKSDFLYPVHAVDTYPAPHVDRVLHDGDAVALGGVVLTAHRTGGHTRGCTTWTMRVHLPGEAEGRLRNVVIVGGYTQWSDYQLVSTSNRVESYPGIADDFRRTFRVYRSLPCEIFLGDHGEHFGLLAKLARVPSEGYQVWIDPKGYASTMDEAERSFEKRLAEQRATGAK